MKLENKTVLVTGAAGFIGANLIAELLGTVKSIRLKQKGSVLNR